MEHIVMIMMEASPLHKHSIDMYQVRGCGPKAECPHC